jgi:hypothetical protein
MTTPLNNILTDDEIPAQIQGLQHVHDAIIADPSICDVAPAVEPIALPKKQWVMHGPPMGIAEYDASGVPAKFFSASGLAFFNSGALSQPCKGKNCGSLNGWLHSAECAAEHAATTTTTPPAAAAPPAPQPTPMQAVSDFARAQHEVAPAVEPKGWKLVPLEPTSEMLDKGQHTNSEWLNDNAPLGEGLYRNPAASVYRAMLAAAPTAPPALPLSMSMFATKADFDAALASTTPPKE